MCRERVPPRADGRDQVGVRPRPFADDEEGRAGLAEGREQVWGGSWVGAVIDGQRDGRSGARAGAGTAECRSQCLAPEAEDAKCQQAEDREEECELGCSRGSPRPEVDAPDEPEAGHGDVQPARPPGGAPGPCPGACGSGHGWSIRRDRRAAGRARWVLVCDAGLRHAGSGLRETARLVLHWRIFGAGLGAMLIVKHKFDRDGALGLSGNGTRLDISLTVLCHATRLFLILVRKL